MAHADMPELFAFMGEDEYGSGEIGVKQVFITSKGLTNLVSVNREKLARVDFVRAMQEQANRFGKTIRLTRYRYIEDVMVITPQG